MTSDIIFFCLCMFILGASLIAVGSHLYFWAKEDYVDRLISKRKDQIDGDW